MRLSELRIQEITYRLRDGHVFDEDVLDLLQSHESLREDLTKVEGGNIRLWKENEELKKKVKCFEGALKGIGSNCVPPASAIANEALWRCRHETT